jgi:hypothetical protein
LGPFRIALLCCLAFPSTACAQASDLRDAASASHMIVVPMKAHVCVRVEVDQAVWPRPIDSETIRNMSGVLMPQLRKLYQDSGLIDVVPGTRSEQRFHVNAIPNHPFCGPDENNVFVSVHYGARLEGTPFVVRYTLQQGTQSLTRSASVDVEAEMAAGRMEPFDRERKLDMVVAQDLLGRAAEIMAYLRFQ